MKKTVLMLLALCFSVGISNAQFGGLGKKLKEKAKSAVTEKVNEAKKGTQQKVEQKVVEEANNLEEYETIYRNYGYYDDKSIGFKGENLGIYANARKTDWDDLQAKVNDPATYSEYNQYVECNGLYYLYRWNKAIDDKDMKQIAGDFYTRTMWCANIIFKRQAENGSSVLYRIGNFNMYSADYERAIEKFQNIVYEGAPEVGMSYKDVKTEDDKILYVKKNLARWNWAVDKAEEAKNTDNLSLSQFYLNYIVNLRQLMLSLQYLKGDEPGFAEFDDRLMKALQETPADFQTENKVLTPAECLAVQKANEEKIAKQKAEREAALLAEIEKNTEDWPKSNMPELDAEALAIMKAKFPHLKITRVSIPNDHWQVMYKGVNIERREVQVWVEFLDEETGKYKAVERYMAQYYSGGGKYGKSQYSGHGERYFWVRK